MVAADTEDDMHIAMHTHGIPGRHHDGLFSYAARRCESALGRLGHQVAQVVLRLSDENGPKGGIAKRCVAEIRLAGGRVLVIEQRGAAWAESIAGSLERGAQALKRVLGRQRDRIRRRE